MSAGGTSTRLFPWRTAVQDTPTHETSTTRIYILSIKRPWRVKNQIYNLLNLNRWTSVQCNQCQYVNAQINKSTLYRSTDILGENGEASFRRLVLGRSVHVGGRGLGGSSGRTHGELSTVKLLPLTAVIVWVHGTGCKNVCMIPGSGYENVCMIPGSGYENLCMIPGSGYKRKRIYTGYTKEHIKIGPGIGLRTSSSSGGLVRRRKVKSTRFVLCATAKNERPTSLWSVQAYSYHTIPAQI